MGCCQSDTVADKKPKEEDYDTFELHVQPPSGADGEDIGAPTPRGRSRAEEWTPPNGSPTTELPEFTSQDGDLASTTNRSHPATLYSPMEQSLYAPSMASNASFAMSATNSINNVTINDVDKYVSHVKDGQSLNGSIGGVEQNFTQQTQIDRCTTIEDLEILETMRRNECHAQFAVTSKMILLAARRVVPVIRRKRAMSTHAKTAVIMVHHRTLDHGGQEGKMESSHRRTSVVAIGDSKAHSHIDPLSFGSSQMAEKGPPSTHFLSPGDDGDETPLPLVVGGKPPCAVHSDQGSQRGRSSSAIMNNTSPPRIGASPEPAGGLPLVEPPPVFALEGYSCMDIECDKKKFKPKPKAYNVAGWDLFSEPDATELLNKGNVLFKFTAKTAKNLSPEDLAYLQPLVNTTAYNNEQEDNNVPIINLSDKENGLWTTICVKTCYMLPGLKLENITPELIGTNEYHTSCEPGPPKCEPYDPNHPNTCRMHVTCVKFVYSITLMLRAAELKGEQAERLEYLDGIVPGKVIIQERTKRNIAKSDGTVTVKSFLCYFPVTGGVLLSNTTIVVNRSVPRVLAPMVNSFGNQGAKDGAETAMLTRAYLIKKFGDSREEMQVGEAPPPLAEKCEEEDKKKRKKK